MQQKFRLVNGENQECTRGFTSSIAPLKTTLNLSTCNSLQINKLLCYDTDMLERREEANMGKSLPPPTTKKVGLVESLSEITSDHPTCES